MSLLAVVTDPWNIRRLAPREKDHEVNKRLEEIRKKARNAGKEENDEIRLLVTGVHLDEDKISDQDRPQNVPITVLPQAPIPHCPLLARVWMLYEQRLIRNGRKYYDESRQTVNLLRDADEMRDVEVVRADDVSPAVWSIQIISKQEPDQAAQTPIFLGARLEDNAPFRELVFTDYGLASKAVHWIRTNPKGTAGKLILNYPGEGVKDADKRPSLVPVKRTLNECAKNYDPNYRGIAYTPLPKVNDRNEGSGSADKGAK